MYLKRLELVGFKTFAQKTVLEFPQGSKDARALTVVVGPNGSGKSNIADAIRWALGEQSLKLLRGKQAQDVIFSGSEGKSRAGFAEVSLTFDNADKTMNLPYHEVTLTRRLYRDGESGYLINGAESRLSDIQLLLAEAGVGQRSYSVIGQGMIDHVLTATPEERKVFFDDAMGVRGFQIKRHQAILKLERSAEHLTEAEMLLAELEPRLASLKRQVSRLERRADIEKELREIERGYYATQWWTLQDEKTAINNRLAGAQERIAAKQAELAAGDKRLAELETVGSGTSEAPQIAPMKEAYKKAQEELALARRAHFDAERDLELARVKAQSTWAPLPLLDIIAEIDGVTKAQQDLLGRLRAVKDMGELETIIAEADAVLARSAKLKQRLTKPNPDDFRPSSEMVAAVSNAKERIVAAEAKVQETEKAMDAAAKNATTQKSELFAFQRQLRVLSQEVFHLEQEANTIRIELARVETRLEGLMNEMRDVIPAEGIAAMTQKAPANRLPDVAAAHETMLRLRHQLELIGGLDEETVKEFETTKERMEFITTQVKDLREAIHSTEKVIDELDEHIRSQSEKSFREINAQFQKYFKVLFGGGTCGLDQLAAEDMEEEETKVALDRALEDAATAQSTEDEQSLASIKRRVKERADAVAGIDIHATPPGKRVRALNLLSGGERALTAIALISAIMATNPSPFVVLDEVDAALDEANTIRFSNILRELQALTQFIVITHNRATMEKADTLYGVTMGGDGISKILSVKLEDVGENGSARR